MIKDLFLRGIIGIVILSGILFDLTFMKILAMILTVLLVWNGGESDGY